MDPGWPGAAGAAAGAAVFRQCLGAHRRPGAALCAAGTGPERGGGLRGPAGPGLCGVLRRGRLHVRADGLAASGGDLRGLCRHVPGRAAYLHLAGDTAGGAAGGHHGDFAGHSGAQAARGLPGHRHAGLRRDHPHLHEQPGPAGQHHQWPQRHRPDRLGQDPGAGPGQAPGDLRLRHQLGHAVLLPVPLPGAGQHRDLLAPAGLAHRPRLDGHPRG